jgi:hypothetical protein
MLAAPDLSWAFGTPATGTRDSNRRTFFEYVGERVLVGGKGPDHAPNVYNSPIMVAGLLQAARRSPDIALPLIRTRGGTGTIAKHLRFLIRQIDEDGCVAAMVPDDFADMSGTGRQTPPSAFSTLWVMFAFLGVLEADQPFREKIVKSISEQEINDALDKIARWAERTLHDLLSAHHARVIERFDVNEAICAISALFRLSWKLPQARQRAGYALDVLFSEYFNAETGSLQRARPIFVKSRENDAGTPPRVIYASTCEALCYLLRCAREHEECAEFLAKHWRKLTATCHLVQRTWQTGERFGHPNDRDAHPALLSLPTAFSTVSAMRFVYEVRRCLEDILDRETRRFLSVPRTPPEVRRGLAYPDNLGAVFDRYMSGKVNSADASERAAGFFSVILFGPPGTSKTSLVKKVAHDLGWPLLIVTQNYFLAEGAGFIDSRAERLFRNLLGLKYCVVLFDELEELVQERSASERDVRLLTTSMLPRIHDLRDRQRVVFIFCTNRLDTFDEAAIRLGRFDAILPIAPLNAHERQTHWKHLVDQHLAAMPSGKDNKAIMADIVKESKAAGFPERFEGLTYPDIEFVVKQLRSTLTAGSTVGPLDLSRLFQDARSVSDDSLEQLKKLSLRYERPKQ